MGAGQVQEFNSQSLLAMPLPAVWGPKLWAILHGIGARCGRSTPQLRRDELRELQWLVAHLETIVPCPECRQHIIAYKGVNPTPESAAEFCVWFYAFHEAVNARLGKPSYPLTPGLGSTTNLTKAWEDFYGCLKESLLKGAVRGDAIAKFKQHLRMWQGFAGV